MGDILDEVSALVQCKECPWYRSCVSPMRYTAEDLRRQLQSAMPGAAIPQAGGYGIENLLASMASAAQSLLLEGCPIFIERLRESPKVAEAIKRMMQGWGKEEAN